VTGPSLRVRAVAYTGAAWTQPSALDTIAEPIVGRSSLLVDGRAIADAVGSLPGVETATVDIGLFGRIEVRLVEEIAVAVWRTNAVQLLVAEDGTVVGTQSRDAALTGDYENLPFVDDARDTSRDLSMGDQVPLDELEAALALAALPPSRVGSTSSILRLSLDPTYGFILASPQAGWQAAFGYYAADPLASSATIEARILAQASGIRTLFAEHPEAGVAWIDARNPGRVYFRARG
jgi:hypothetical protein